MQTTKWIEDRRDFGGGTEIKIVETQVPDLKARLAADFAKHFALVAAMPDGEDTAGRQKCRLATPEECAQRACALADQLWKEFQVRKWIVDLPMPQPRSSEEERIWLSDEREAARRAARKSEAKASDTPSAN